MKMRSKFMSAAVVGTLLVALAGCQKSTKADQAPVAEPPASIKLPISINATMVGLVDRASDFLFAIGNGDLPRNDHEWDVVRNSAYQMVIAGKVIQLEGTGQNDAQWVANPEWKKYSEQLSAIGLEAEKLADAKDPKGWDIIGGKLIDTCQACHMSFKPSVPSQGILHEGTKWESEGKSVFDRN